MAEHRILVRASSTFRGTALLADCSCGAHIKSDDRSQATLDELNRLAHEHIEAAEQGGWPARPENPDISPVYVGQAYGAESAVTSEDELVDLAAEGRSGAIGLG